MSASLPLDIVGLVAEALHAAGDGHTIAQLARTSWDVFEVAVPWLYRDFVINHRSEHLLGLVACDLNEFPDGQGVPTDHLEWLELFEYPGRRRLAAFAHCRRVTVESLPLVAEDTVGFATTAKALAVAGRLLFPRATAVCLQPTAVDQLSLWEGPSLPPLLEALKAATSPTTLCMSYRLVPAAEYAEHRYQVRTAYAPLPGRIRDLAESWTLQSCNYHDVVWEQLTMLPGTTNIYEFGPPPLPHPLFRGRWAFPTMEQDTLPPNIPGPSWSERVDQIQNIVLRVSQDIEHGDCTSWEDTRWVFCGSDRHIQTPPPVTHPAIDVNMRHALDTVRKAFQSAITYLEADGRFVPASLRAQGEYRPAQVCPACLRGCLVKFPLMPGDPADHPVSTMDSIDPLLTAGFAQGVDFAF